MNKRQIVSKETKKGSQMKNRIDWGPKMTAAAELIGSAGGGFLRALETMSLMGVAEDVLSKHGLEKARTAEDRSLFVMMTPTAPLEFVRDERTYAAHCDEICVRFLAGEDLDPPTKVELTATMLRASEEAPLSALGLAVLALAAEGTPIAEFVSPSWIERFPGQAAEELQVVSKRLSKEIGKRGGE